VEGFNIINLMAKDVINDYELSRLFLGWFEQAATLSIYSFYDVNSILRMAITVLLNDCKHSGQILCLLKDHVVLCSL